MVPEKSGYSYLFANCEELDMMALRRGDTISPYLIILYLYSSRCSCWWHGMCVMRKDENNIDRSTELMMREEPASATCVRHRRRRKRRGVFTCGTGSSSAPLLRGISHSVQIYFFTTAEAAATKAH